MRFALTEDQEAIADLAGTILRDRCTPDAHRERERRGDWFDEDVWQLMAEANLLGLPLPEDDGGSGLGMLEAALVLEAVGRYVAPVPYLATVVQGGMAIASFGTDEQRRAWLPGVARGEVVLTAGLAEDHAGLVPASPATTASPSGDGWRLDGVKCFVPWADVAARVVVPARTEDGDVAVFLVDPEAPGVTVERSETSTHEPLFAVTLDGVQVGAAELLGEGKGGELLSWIVDHTLAGLCAVQAGVCQEALAITAGYVSEREQFGQKIATFQAVAQRAADAYIDTQGVLLTARQVAWRLGAGLPATDEVAIAKFWSAEGAQRVVHTAQHLHGGMGLDLDYPLHRYFRWAKGVELTLGNASQQLATLGDRMAVPGRDAASPVSG